MMARLGFTLVGLLLVLLILGSTGASYGQLDPVEEQKGQIWTITAQRVWTDLRLKEPRPPAWKTYKQFNNWLNDKSNDKASKKSELGLLLDGVIQRTNSSQPVSPPKVARAILDDISQRKQQKNGQLARVKLRELEADLQEFVSSATAEIADTTPDSLESDSISAAKPAAVVSAAAPAPTAQELRPEPAAPAEPRSGSAGAPGTFYFEQHPYQTAALAGMLGLLLGAGLIRLFWRSGNSGKSVGSYSSNLSTGMETPEAHLRKKIGELEFKVRDLKRNNEELLKENAQLKAQLTGSTAIAASAAAAPSEPPKAEPAVAAPEAIDSEELLTVSLDSATVATLPAPEAPAVPLTRYGPVQETPFLEERKLTDNPLPRLALMLTAHPQHPDQASFTLNPHVDQEMLIGDGLNRLQKFFEYDPPLGGRINAVKAASPGRLQRQADGWQVVERARLIIT